MKLIRDPADGKYLRDPDDGKMIGGADAGQPCACCEEGHNCHECGACCFSDQSTAAFSYSLNTVKFSSGSDFDSAWLSKSGTGLTFDSAGTSVNWTGGDPEFLVGENCSLSGESWGISHDGTAGLPTAGSPVADPGSAVLSAYTVDVGIPDTGSSPSVGDCCGGTMDDYDPGVGQTTIQITHYTRELIEDEFDPEAFTYGEWVPVAERLGIGDATVTISNNNCCKDTNGDCQTVAGNCDGTCEEDI